MTLPRFLDTIFKPVFKIFPKFLAKFSFKRLAMNIGKSIGKGLRFVPYLGALIDFAFAYSRFKKGDYIGGTIDVLIGVIGLAGDIVCTKLF